MRRPGAWGQFLFAAHRSPEGRQAYLAYRTQRELALAAPAKLKVLARLLERHNGDRVIIFTNDNATVYTIARQFLVPVITHQTKTKERRDVLLRFNSGDYPIVATSKVLNEGVNVPEANVAIILSGSGSVREHVQRLGPDPAEIGRQGSDPLRGHHAGDGRGVHLEPPPAAQRLRRRLTMRRATRCVAAVCVLLLTAADEAKRALFDGKSFDGWKDAGFHDAAEGDRRGRRDPSCPRARRCRASPRRGRTC